MSKKERDITKEILKNIKDIRMLDVDVNSLKAEIEKPKQSKSKIEKLVLKVKKRHDKVLGKSGAEWSCAMARDVLSMI